MLIRKRQWESQPQDRLALSSSMSDRLAYFMFADYHIYGISLPTLTLGTNARVSVGVEGIGWRGNGAGIWDTTIAPIVTSDGLGTGDYTLFALSNAVAAGISGMLISQYADGTSRQSRLQTNMSGALVDASGGIAFMDYDTNGVFSKVGVSSGAVDGKPHLFKGIRRGTTYELWADGILLASATQTVRDIHSNTSTSLQIGGTGAASARPMQPGDFVFMNGGFNRALSYQEASDFGKNWWTFPFKYTSGQIPAYQPADSILVPPYLSNPGVSNITTTGAQPVVKVEY